MKVVLCKGKGYPQENRRKHRPEPNLIKSKKTVQFQDLTGIIFSLFFKGCYALKLFISDLTPKKYSRARRNKIMVDLSKTFFFITD